MALTAEQLSDLRADLGAIEDDYSDSQLNRNWDRVANAATDALRYNATLGLCFRQARAKYLKLHDYQAGQVDEKLSQVKKWIDDMAELYAGDLDAALADKGGLAMAGLRRVPHQRRRWPEG